MSPISRFYRAFQRNHDLIIVSTCCLGAMFVLILAYGGVQQKDEAAQVRTTQQAAR